MASDFQEEEVDDLKILVPLQQGTIETRVPTELKAAAQFLVAPSSTNSCREEE